MSPRGPLEGPPVPTRRCRTDGLLLFATGRPLQKQERGSLTLVQLMEQQTLAAAYEQSSSSGCNKVPPLRASRRVPSSGISPFVCVARV